jgi:hypothetical protein
MRPPLKVRLSVFGIAIPVAGQVQKSRVVPGPSSPASGFTFVEFAIRFASDDGTNADRLGFDSRSADGSSKLVKMVS